MTCATPTDSNARVDQLRSTEDAVDHHHLLLLLLLYVITSFASVDAKATRN